MGETRVLHALVVDGSPEPSSPKLVAALASGAEYVVAADRGAAWCHAAGVVPHVFCGDADTIPVGDLAWVESLDVECVVVPADKYVTDLTLALEGGEQALFFRCVGVEDLQRLVGHMGEFLIFGAARAGVGAVEEVGVGICVDLDDALPLQGFKDLFSVGV